MIQSLILGTVCPNLSPKCPPLDSEKMRSKQHIFLNSSLYIEVVPAKLSPPAIRKCQDNLDYNKGFNFKTSNTHTPVLVTIKNEQSIFIKTYSYSSW
jgi:hypothetical protein